MRMIPLILGLVSRVRGVDGAVRHVFSNNIDDGQDFVIEVVHKIYVGLGHVFGLTDFD
jgi:2-phosphoglycerate kinase